MEKKVLLLQDKKQSKQNSERLRKNIKAAYNDVGVVYTENINDVNYSIAHILPPVSLSFVNELKSRNKKVVLSLLYSETEQTASFTNYFKVDTNDELEVASSTLKHVEKCDLVLVPCDEYKELLTKRGIEKSKIKVVTPGINNKIYQYLSESDMELARRYFSISKEDKIITAFGSYNDKVCLERIEECARLRPDIKIIFLGSEYPKKNIVQKIFDKIHQNKPNNVIYSQFIDINIYRSLLKNSRVVLLLNSKRVDLVQILEAFASEAQVIAIDDALPKEVQTQMTIHSDDINDIYKMLGNFLEYKISNTISEAHFYVIERDVANLGISLLNIYEKLESEE